MKKKSQNKFILASALCGFAPCVASVNSDAAHIGTTVKDTDPFANGDKPNILWLTFEDTSSFLLGCYGNKETQTPNMDSLANVGLRFTNAYSNGPQSSPSRSTIITGCYATTYGMEQHRGGVYTPTDIFYPPMLSAAGYYCTNNKKTDYNTKVDHKSLWDECSINATYNSAKRENKPFFAVFNAYNTHMSRLISVNLDGRETRNLPSKGLYGNNLPAHIPNHEWMKSDYAFHEEGVNEIDIWVGHFLDDLKNRNLIDNTIIFIYSDHGGCLPRGKGFAYESSYRVPLIVYVPPKWQSLIPADMKIGEPVGRLVAFTDLAPTLFRLINEPVPTHMQGIPFLGKDANETRKYQYGFVGNQNLKVPYRTVSDGKWKYIRRYVPFVPESLPSTYQLSMAANLKYDELYWENKLSDKHSLIYTNNECELLFNLEDDPSEINNLAHDAKYAAKLKELRSELSAHIRKSGDLGFFPGNTRNSYKKNKQPISLYEYSKTYDMEKLYSLAELSATVSPADVENLLPYLRSSDKALTHWAAILCAQLARSGQLSVAPQELIDLMNSKYDFAAEYAAYAVYYTKQKNQAIRRMKSDPKKFLSMMSILSYDPNTHADIRKHFKAGIEAFAQTDRSGQSKRILATIGTISHLDILAPKPSVNKRIHKITPLP